MTKAIEIKLEDIALLHEFMPRNGIDSDVVAEYSENIIDLPPILVAVSETTVKPYILIDGWHRYHAHDEVGHRAIMAIVDKKLKREDYFFTAARSNKAHGLRFDAREKKKIAKRLFTEEGRSATEICEAIGCSVRHANDLIKEWAHDKKQTAIKLAKQMAEQHTPQREIAEQLTKMGFKASKSSVDRWLKVDDTPKKAELESFQEPPRIGEVPKRDTMKVISDVPTLKPIMNVNDEPATVAPMLYPPKPTITGSRFGVCPGCNTRTVRIPDLSPGMSAVCTELFFHCDKCEEYVSIRTLLPKADDKS